MTQSEHESIASLWCDALLQCMQSQFSEQARQGVVTKRVQGASFRLLNPEQSILECPARGFKLKYGCGEFVWYLTEHATLEQIQHYAPSYSQYANDDFGFYGPRLHVERQSVLEQCARELKASSSCRRAVAAPWRTDDVFFGHKSDLPCTLSYQFLVLDGKLNMIATMRSNDVWLGMPNDIFVNCCVQIAVAKLAGYGLGWYQHQVGDLHLYNRHWDKADDINVMDLKASSIEYDNTSVRWSDLQRLVDLDACIRTGMPMLEWSKFTDPFLNFIYKGLLS